MKGCDSVSLNIDRWLAHPQYSEFTLNRILSSATIQAALGTKGKKYLRVGLPPSTSTVNPKAKISESSQIPFCSMVVSWKA